MNSLTQALLKRFDYRLHTSCQSISANAVMMLQPGPLPYVRHAPGKIWLKSKSSNLDDAGRLGWQKGAAILAGFLEDWPLRELAVA